MGLTDEELARMLNPVDPPDFQFPYDELRVALEHTQIFRPTSKASLRPPHDLAIQHRISDHLNRLVKQPDCKMPPVMLSITFGSCHTVRMEDEPVIAQGVFDLVSNRLADGASLPMTLFMHDLSGISPSLGDVLVMEGGSSSTVVRHTGGSVDEWGLASFENAAREKAKDLPRYGDRFDQRWLLLSAGGPHRAQWFEPSPTACEL